MDKAILTVVLMFLSSVMAKGGDLVVVGEDGGVPVAGAALLSADGHIIGITDNSGKAGIPNDLKYPVTVRSLGYDLLTLAQPADTVILHSVEYSLPELSVTASERPVRRIVWYSREYSTGAGGTDSMQLYSEYMFESYIVDGKVKGYHSSDARLRTKAVRRYGRIAGANRRDSVFMPGEGDEITVLAWGNTFCHLPEGKTEEPPAIRDGASLDSVAGEYAVGKLFQKAGNRFVVNIDRLSGHKNHSWSPSLFKIFGMTIDISQYNSTYCYQQNDRGIYDLYDMMYSSFSLDILGRGKLFKWLFKSKEPFRMNTYIELYPVDITSHTLDEYKEMRKDKSTLDFQIPSAVLPEIPAVTELKRVL